MFKRLMLFAALLLTLPAAANAQDGEGDHAGTWAFRINDAHIWVFTMQRDGEAGWNGTWLRPARFEGNGVVFVRFAGEELVETEDGMQRENTVQLRFRPTQRGGTGDVLHFTLTGPNEMTMEYLGTELEPYPLIRVVRGTGLGPFSEGMIYDRDNAVTVSDYDPADEPAEEAAADDTVIEDEEDTAEADAEEEAASEDEADDAAGDEDAGVGEPDADAPTPRIGADFLGTSDDNAAEAPADAEAAHAEDASEEPLPELPGTENARACSDLNRRNLPSPAELDELWGEDFEQLGNGLDIREYAMDNGDIARVTVLDDRIYLNRCGPA